MKSDYRNFEKKKKQRTRTGNDNKCVQMAAKGDKKIIQDELVKMGEEVDRMAQMLDQLQKDGGPLAQLEIKLEKYQTREMNQDKTKKCTHSRVETELISENKQKECKLQSLRTQSELNEKTIQKQLSTIASLEQKVVELVGQVKKMKEEKMTVEQQHSSQMKIYKEDMTSKESENDQLKQSIEQVMEVYQEDMLSKQSEIDNLKQSTEKAMEMYQKDMEEKQSKIDQLKQSKEQVQNQNTILEDNIKKLKEGLNHSIYEKYAVQKSLLDTTNRLQITSEVRRRLTRTVEENIQLLNEKTIVSAQLEMKLTEEMRNHKALRQKYHALCVRIQDIMTRNKILECEVQALKEKSEKFADEKCESRDVQTAECEHNETSEIVGSANTRLGADLEEAKADIKRLQDSIKPKEDEIQKRGVEIENLFEAYTKCWKAFQEKESEVKALEKKYADLIGCQNLEQKVTYTQKPGEEKQLAEELSKLNSKNAQLKDFIASKGFNEELQKFEIKVERE